MRDFEPLRIEPDSLKFLCFSRHREMIYRGARMAFYDIGNENVKYTRMIILKGPKTGRFYRIPGRKRLHRASAPGEAPANLFGKLRKGVDFEVRGNNQMEFGDTVQYGYWLELGSSRMEPRPHLMKAIKTNERYAEQRLGLEALKQLNRGAKIGTQL